jgi:adenylate cyclase, class 2
LSGCDARELFQVLAGAETLTDEAALGDVRAVLGKLGVAEDDLTTEQYTDAVMRARA